MPRPYSDKLLINLNRFGPDTLEVRLGRLCVEANIPASYVAVALETSRMTVHSWFRGTKARKSKHKLIEAFISLVQKDMKDGKLPAKNHLDAKAYIEEMLGISF